MLSPSSGGSSRSKIRSRKCLDYFQDTTLISDFCGAEITAILRAASERGLPSLLIGANAIVLLGYIRNTVDLDLLVPEQSRLQWLDLRELAYRVFHGIEAFAQFEPADKTGAPVDLMFVEEATWEKLIESAREMDLSGQRVLVSRPEYLVALKLHAAGSRLAANQKSIGKIRQIVRICALDPERDDPFRELILRYGSEDALAKIQSFSRRR